MGDHDHAIRSHQVPRDWYVQRAVKGEGETITLSILQTRSLIPPGQAPDAYLPREVVVAGSRGSQCFSFYVCCRSPPSYIAALRVSLHRYMHEYLLASANALHVVVVILLCDKCDIIVVLLLLANALQVVVVIL